MSVSALHAKIVASTTGGQTEACGTCPSAGMPILLTRYGIDPSGPETTPPTFPNGYAPPKLGSARRQLRVLREGFVHVALQFDHLPGKIVWMCYMVTADGLLAEIPTGAPPPATNTIACKRKTHGVNAALIAIPAPDVIHTAHFAFAEDKWNQATLDDYSQILLGKPGAPKTGRAKARFVSISPKQWVSAGNDFSSAPSNAWPYTKVFNVFEYKAGLTSMAASELANRTGFQCTPRPTARELVDRMNHMRVGRGMVLALPDPLGEAKELNVVRSEALSALRAYAADEDLLWKAQSAYLIEGIKAGVEKRAEEQTKTAMARPPYMRPGVNHGRGGATHGDAKNVKATYVRQGLRPIAGEYNEKALAAFLQTYDRELDKLLKRLQASDKDYTASLSESHLYIALSDYTDDVAGRVCFTVACVDAIAGGGMTDESLEWWRDLLERDPADRRNLGVRVSLGDHSPVIEALKLTDTELFDWLWTQDSGSRIKAGDIIRNYALDDGMKARYFAAMSMATTSVLATIRDLLSRYDGQKSQLVTGNARVQEALTTSALKISAASYKTLIVLQKKLMRAFYTVHLGMHSITLKLKVTVEEFRFYVEAFGDRHVKVQVRHPKTRTLAPHEQQRHGDRGPKQGRPKTTTKVEYESHGYGSMRQFAERDSLAKKALSGGTADIEFTVTASRAQLDDVVADITERDLDAKAAANQERTNRTISVVENNAASKIKAAQNLPARQSDAEIARTVRKLGAHAGKIAASVDVMFTSMAVVLNYLHLRNMTRDLMDGDLFDTEEARVAFASAVFGASGVGLEIAGKLGNLLQAFSPAGGKATGTAAAAATAEAQGVLARLGATQVGRGLVARAAALIGTGTVLGSVAVAFDSVQMAMVSKDRFAAGDTDAFAYSLAGSASFAGAAVALVASAAQYLPALKFAADALALIGITNPFAAGLFLLGIGAMFAYLAFTAEDQPITTWVKRSRFGDNEKDRFRNRHEEWDSWELMQLGFDIHLRWLDRPFADARNAYRLGVPEEVEIVIKYPSNTRGTLVYGLVVSGPGGRACFTPVGVGALDINTIALPRVFDSSQCPRYYGGATIPERDAAGGGYDTGGKVTIKGTSVVTGTDLKVGRELQREGTGPESESRITDNDLSGFKKSNNHPLLVTVEHAWQVAPERFDTAELHIRYFPDASKPDYYFDTMHPVRD